VQDIGEKEKRLMKKTIKYTDEPIGDLKIVADFLPSPKDLIFKDDTVKITISLTKESVEFFKKEAEKHHTQYQKMIRNLLDVYATNHQIKVS
jgi:predicted DNA binding CopG/RHH family protein